MGNLCSVADSSAKKTIVVFGSTGAQGGALVRAILGDTKNNTFLVRAVTRDPTSDKAIALKNLGAQVVKCDSNVPAEVEEALSGAYGAFFVTQPFDPTSCSTPDAETAQMKTFAEASASVGLKHVIMSSLVDTRKFVPLSSDEMPTLTLPTSDGGKRDYKIPHFESKADGEVYFSENSVPTTFIKSGFYYENYLTYFPLTKAEGAENTFTITLPTGESKFPMIAVEDLGKVSYSMFKKPNEAIGKSVGLSGTHMNVDEVASVFSSVLGVTVQHNKYVTPEIFRTFGFPGCEDLGNMLQFYRDYDKEFLAIMSVEGTRKWSPTKSFEAWVKENKDKFDVSS